MAITLNYAPDPRLLAEAAMLAGQGEFAQKQDVFRQGADQFALNLGQRQSEFDRSMGQRQHEFGLNYGMDAAKFGYQQFDDTRKFGENVRQYDTTFGEGVRRFDEGMGFDREKFGEQQRQTDIENQFGDAKLGQQDAQFGAQLGLSYDQMAQKDFQLQQEQAFQAQQQQERTQAAFAQQDQQNQQRKWDTYAGLEAERFGMFTKQGMAELDTLRKTKFRTPELQAAAYDQWEQQYGNYMAAPINLGPPPEVQQPWDSVPMREFTLSNGQKVNMLARPDGKGGWIPDASLATLEQKVVDQNADNERMQAQVELDRTQGEQGLEFKGREFELRQQSQQFDSKVKEYQGRLDGYAAAQKSRDTLRQILMRQAEREAGKNEDTEAPNPISKGRIAEIESEVNQIPLPPMPQWESVVGGGQSQNTSGNSNTYIEELGVDMSVPFMPSTPKKLQEILSDLQTHGQSGKWITVETPDGRRRKVQVP